MWLSSLFIGIKVLKVSNYNTIRLIQWINVSYNYEAIIAIGVLKAFRIIVIIDMDFMQVGNFNHKLVVILVLS